MPKFRYTLRVEPASEPPFEAELAIRPDHPDYAPGVGSTVAVLFDPDDHEKVAFDLDPSTNAGKRKAGTFGSSAPAGVDKPQHFRSERSAPDGIDKLKELADLHDRGALTDAEFESQKAKLLND